MSLCILKKRGPGTALAYRRSAFSLIEILVTVAIIGVLAALAFPALRDSSAKADGARCVSNLRKLVSAAILYGSENGTGYLPVISNDPLNGTAHNHWMFNENYLSLMGDRATTRAVDLSATFRCPTAGKLKNPSGIQYGMNVTSIDINANYNTPGWAPNMRNITRPSEKIYLIDGLDWMIQSNRAGNYNPNTRTEAATTYTPAFRHNGRAHVAFFDGHIESLKQLDVLNKTRMWNVTDN